MFKEYRKEIEWGGRPLVFETGKVARQADGAVMVTYGDTKVLCTVVGEKRRVISVISGSDTKNQRSSDSIKLISWGLRNTNTYEISDKETPKFEFKTWLGKKESVKGITLEDVYVTISKKEVKDFKVLLKYDGPINAPIKKGDEIGEIIIKLSNEEDRIIPIFAHEDVKKVNFFKSLFMSFNYMIWGDV